MEANLIYYHMSHIQKWMWEIENKKRGTSSLYNNLITHQIEGLFNQEVMEKSILFVVNRHQILRTIFKDVNDEKVQIVLPKQDHKLNLYDLRNVVEKDLEKEARCILNREVQTIFDLKKGPMFQVTVLLLTESCTLLLITMHNSISDSYSMKIFLDELMECYKSYLNNATSELDELTFQYGDFVELQQQMLYLGKYKNQLEYWDKQLSNFQGFSKMYNDNYDSRSFISKLDYQYVEIDKKIIDDIYILAKNYGVTTFTLSTAILYVLLFRYMGNGEQDITIVIKKNQRFSTQYKHTIGNFSDLSLLRIKLCDNLSFPEVVSIVEDAISKSDENKDIPYELVAEKFGIYQLNNMKYSFPVAVIHMEDLEEYDKPSNGRVIPFNAEKDDMLYNFALHIMESPENKPKIRVKYNSKVFSNKEVLQIIDHLYNLLKSFTNQEGIISYPDYITDKEKEIILYEFNKKNKVYPCNFTIVELFENQAKKTPFNNVAIKNDIKTSYNELLTKANVLSNIIAKNKYIGLMMNEGPKLLIGIIGILKSGNCIVPINPKFPIAKVCYMVEDSRIELILTDNKNYSKAKEVASMNSNIKQVLCIDSIDFNTCYDAKMQAEEKNHINPENECYIIYTSGSTGEPKGVPITHKNLTPLLLWAKDYFAFDEDTRVIQNLSYCFDFGLLEIFTTLLSGGTLYYFENNPLRDMERYLNYINFNKINTIHTTPTFFSFIVSAKKKLPFLKTIDLGGEKVNYTLVNDISNLVSSNCKILNGYGPTETSITATMCQVEVSKENRVVSIGKPTANNTIYILDDNQNPVPIGVKGEIYIGGGGLSSGYLNRPDLTKDRFINSPFSFQEKLYRTGDIGRWEKDGSIEYIERKDFQVKILGYRIEPAEIEYSILKYSGIKEAVVLPIEKEFEHKITRKILCAFICADKNVKVVSVKEHLAKYLPSYMIPSLFVILDNMPLNSNGKADRKKLLEKILKK